MMPMWIDMQQRYASREWSAWIPPRVILVPGWVSRAGKDISAAEIIRDIADHTLDNQSPDRRNGGLLRDEERDLFDMEYRSPYSNQSSKAINSCPWHEKWR